MTQSRRDQINLVAEKVRMACEIETPVNIEEVVFRLKGDIVITEDEDYEAKIEKKGEGFLITLACMPKNRRRFSIAHELGHLFLHMGYLINEEKWSTVETYTDSVYYRYGFNTEEMEANEFAAALLMPRNEFYKVASQNCNNNRYRIDPIAAHFQVSNEAAINRGRWLGLFSWD